MLLCTYTLWQAWLWHLVWYHLLECSQATLHSLAQLATTSTLELPSTSAAPSLTQVMPSPYPSTRTGWWSVAGTWWTQHWQRQPLQPPRRLSSCSSSTSNQSMTVSITALPVQVTQWRLTRLPCTSMDQVRTAWSGWAMCRCAACIQLCNWFYDCRDVHIRCLYSTYIYIYVHVHI